MRHAELQRTSIQSVSNSFPSAVHRDLSGISGFSLLQRAIVPCYGSAQSRQLCFMDTDAPAPPDKVYLAAKHARRRLTSHLCRVPRRATSVGWVSRSSWCGTVKRPNAENVQPPKNELVSEPFKRRRRNYGLTQQCSSLPVTQKTITCSVKLIPSRFTGTNFSGLTFSFGASGLERRLKPAPRSSYTED